MTQLCAGAPGVRAGSLGTALALLLFANIPTRAAAQLAAPEAPAPDYVPAKNLERVQDRAQGWSHGLTLAANLNLASNRDVVGQLNGNSVLFGASALVGLSYVRERHEWLNTGALNEAWSRTPAIDHFVKSNDLLDLQSLYNFFLLDWTGPFVRLALQTGLLKTERVTAAAETYVSADDPTVAETSTSFDLSDPFQPFTLNESAGWFFQPLRGALMNLYARVGFGGRHTFAEGARAITDADDTEAVEYSELSDVHQAGAELFAGVDGKLAEGRLLYNLGASALFPFLNNDEQERGIAELTKVALSGALGMNVLSWLSVNYQLKVVRDVQLVDAIQVQNALLLSLQYTHATPASAKAPDKLPPEVELRIRELEARAVAAEQRAVAAEARERSEAVNPPPAEPAAEPPHPPEP